MPPLLARLPDMVSDTSGEFIGTTPAPPSGDRVELTDLEVIQRWSLAVRGASAERSDVIAALRADLEWLQGSRRTDPIPPRTAKTTTKPPSRTTVKKTAAKTPTAKKSAGRTATGRGGTRRK